MKPIWYFVGLILLIMGGIIFLNGIYQALNPETVNTVLKETHPSLWWGAVMLISGAIMFFKTKNQSV